MKGKKGQGTGSLKIAIYVVLGLLFLVILIMVINGMINTSFSKPR